MPATLLDLGSTSSKAHVAERILQMVFRYRRRPRGAHACEPACSECRAPHLKRAQDFIARGEPIHFVLPAFPAKSPNRTKVLGTLPDFGESLALDFLQALCDRIRALYAPGARITIGSDGRVFSDVVGVSDRDVTAYTAELRRLIRERRAESLDVFGLDDDAPDLAPDARRLKLLADYGLPIEMLRVAVKTSQARLNARNGIARFLFEDLVTLEPATSRNALRERANETAYSVLQRSMAWSALLARRFPRAVRLSIHPQAGHEGKLGIHLLPSQDDWLTPWHGVAVDLGDRYVLMKRRQAEALGAVLVTREGRPSHFVLPSADQELRQ